MYQVRRIDYENSIDPSSDSPPWKSNPRPKQSDDASNPSGGTNEGRSTGGSPSLARAALS
jgi:hypothetical protein